MLLYFSPRRHCVHILFVFHIFLAPYSAHCLIYSCTRLDEQNNITRLWEIMEKSGENFFPPLHSEKISCAPWILLSWKCWEEGIHTILCNFIFAFVCACAVPGVGKCAFNGTSLNEWEITNNQPSPLEKKTHARAWIDKLLVSRAIKSVSLGEFKFKISRACNMYVSGVCVQSTKKNVKRRIYVYSSFFLSSCGCSSVQHWLSKHENLNCFCYANVSFLFILYL